MRRFADRRAAGRALAAAVPALDLALGLPRGGVIVAAELPGPLDALTVRKLRVPDQQELAFGAVATGGIRVLNEDVVRRADLTRAQVERIAARETAALAERERAYRGNRPAPVLTGRSVAVVDDGIATGATMLAACRAVRAAGPARLVAAVPVASTRGVQLLAEVADEVVTLSTPDPFYAVGAYYEEFGEVSDEDVLAALAAR